MFTLICGCGASALGANTAAHHSIRASRSADFSQPLPEPALQGPYSVDPQDGCEEGCHYCNGPETD